MLSETGLLAALSVGGQGVIRTTYGGLPRVVDSDRGRTSDLRNEMTNETNYHLRAKQYK